MNKISNTVLIVSDQHNRSVLGCYGNPIVKTPNLDYLSKIGTRFSCAYTNSPICMPARAALATGLYTHETGNWDNAFPYNGSIKSWQHILRDNNYRVDAIGKLHFRSQDAYSGVSGCLRNCRPDTPEYASLDLNMSKQEQAVPNVLYVL